MHTKKETGPGSPTRQGMHDHFEGKRRESEGKRGVENTVQYPIIVAGIYNKGRLGHHTHTHK